ncbi:ABC transporter permease [Peribacillus cavernae]|uniref:ABC transporter permease n=1 Tax=Peribacillus cavernae TaxID=1674310 RepID=UPI00163BF463|nr:ABC transporter permease subunit [Peribacillus cavernae]MDQ0217237.1 NitT/TauT family transport system permease protein [Peribacillus cavernae]
MKIKTSQQKWYAFGRYMVPVAIIILWEIIYLMLGEPAMASPWQSVVELKENANRWLGDMGNTVFTLLISFIIASISGVILGFFIGLSAFWTKTLSPLLLGLYSIPKVTLYPIFLLIFGLTLQGRVAFSVFHGIFPIMIICMEATRTVPDIYLKLAKSYRMSFMQKARQILIPAIMPQLVVGLRMSFSLCFLGLILAEMFASYEGLGHRLVHYMSLNQPSSILAIIIFIVFIAFFFTFLFLIWQEKNEQKIGKRQINLS